MRNTGKKGFFIVHAVFPGLALHRAFRGLESDREWRQFMVTHGYTEAGNPDEIPLEDLIKFRGETAQSLREWGENPPALDEWQSRAQMIVDAQMNARTLGDRISSRISFTDVLLTLLGLVVAFRLGMGFRSEEEE